MLCLKLHPNALPLGLIGPGGITSYLDQDDMPHWPGDSRPITVRGERIGTVIHGKHKSGSGQPIMLDLPREWRVIRANAGPTKESETNTTNTNGVA